MTFCEYNMENSRLYVCYHSRTYDYVMSQTIKICSNEPVTIMAMGCMCNQRPITVDCFGGNIHSFISDVAHVTDLVP